MKKITLLIAFVVSFVGFSSAQSPISADEKKVVDLIDKSYQRVVALLEETVNIPSATEDLKGVRDVGRVFEREFNSIGFEAKWLELPKEMNRAGHFYAETKGTKGKRLLLIGHLDTVLTGEKFRIEGNRGYGTGTVDMKAGNVVVYYALKALQEAGVLKDRQIIVLFTGDEENSGEPISTSRRDLVEAAKRSDLALSFENGGSGIATVARRGISDWRLEVTGNTGHSSQIFREAMGDGAIFEAARIINQFQQTLKGEKYLTFNPSLFSGGTELKISDQEISATGKTNVVPARAIVRGDLRFISDEQHQLARAKMREIVSKNLPGTTAKIEFFDGIPSMSPRAENYAILKELDQVSRDLGFGKVEAQDPGERGAGDISFIAEMIPGLDGLGGTGAKAHAPGEYADLDTLTRQIKRTALLIYRLTR